MRSISIKAMVLALCICSIAASCNKAPDAKVADVTPANSVPETPPSSAASAVLTTPPAVEIFYAQIGTQLTSERLIKEPKAEIGNADTFYALGVFKGKADTDAQVKLRILDDRGQLVYHADQSFAPDGEKPVLFEIVRSEAKLGKGQYRVFFDLNGSPCWELHAVLE